VIAHTCINTAGYLPQPPCPGCQEHFEAKVAAEREVLLAAKAFYRRNPYIERVLTVSLDAAIGKLIALGDF
jgi:hypothetical protein